LEGSPVLIPFHTFSIITVHAQRPGGPNRTQENKGRKARAFTHFTKFRPQKDEEKNTKALFGNHPNMAKF